MGSKHMKSYVKQHQWARPGPSHLAQVVQRDPAIWFNLRARPPPTHSFASHPSGVWSRAVRGRGPLAKKVEAKIAPRSRKTVLFPSGWAWSEVEGGK